MTEQSNHWNDGVRTAAVADIYEADRHRRDMGDLDALADSIRDVGLLQPIVVAPDGRLIAGGRRLAAVRILEWGDVPVRVASSLTDAAALLRAERDENTVRKDFDPSEVASIGAALADAYRPEAEARRAEGNAAGAAVTNGALAAPGNRERVRVRDQVAEAVGVSGPTYERIRTVADDIKNEGLPPERREAAQAAMDAMDAGAPVRPTVEAYRRDVVGEAIKDNRRAGVYRDTQFGTVREVVRLLTKIPGPGELELPEDDGNVADMDDAIRWLAEWLPDMQTRWATHVAELNEKRAA